jgi:hypothetical protein
MLNSAFGCDILKTTGISITDGPDPARAAVPLAQRPFRSIVVSKKPGREVMCLQGRLQAKSKGSGSGLTDSRRLRQ